LCFLGVKNVDANVEAKTVIVDADESVKPEFLLEKLMKVGIYWHLFPSIKVIMVQTNRSLTHRFSSLQWSKATGKSVEMA